MNIDGILNKMSPRKILDNDLYKFTMMWFVMSHFPESKVRYEFVNRKNIKFSKGIAQVLRKRIDTMRNSKLSKEDRFKAQEKLPFLPNLFWDMLEGFRLDPTEVAIIEKNGDLIITIEGYWYRTMLWEVILLSELSEINFLITGERPQDSLDVLAEHDIAKAKFFRGNAIPFADFGTRRRYSLKNHNRIVGIMDSYAGNTFVGTSNVQFAIDYNIKAIGTYAHEVVSGVAAKLGYAHANKHMMELWTQTFNGNLGIALTDTFGLDAFLNDFDTKYAKLFDGVRHDSGDPFVFGEKIIEHYKKLGIDPESKTIVFSDGLDPQTANKIFNKFNGRIKISFGIGTNLTNDFENITPLNIVIKLFEIDGNNVIKLSDVAGKHTGDKNTIELVKQMINYKELC